MWRVSETSRMYNLCHLGYNHSQLMTSVWLLPRTRKITLMTNGLDQDSLDGYQKSEKFSKFLAKNSRMLLRRKMKSKAVKLLKKKMSMMI